MSDLTDRYVAATLRSVPEKQRVDIEAELRGSIEDAIDARSDAGMDTAEAEREVLTDLGDPDRLAAGYSGQPMYLVGPDHFFTYKRLLGVLVLTVVPIVAALVVVAQVLAGTGFGEVIGTAVTTTITLAVHLCFWTTLVFHMIDRYGGIEETQWTLDSLPAAATVGEPKLGEMIASVVFLSLVIAVLALSTSISPATDAQGSMVPFFDPDLWSFWMPYFIVILGAEIVFEVIKYRAGRWTWSLASVNLVLNLAFAVPAIYLLSTDQLINPSFFSEMGWGDGPTATDLSIRLVIAGIAGVTVWDVFSGFRNAWLQRRG